jgi:hypothetical protein
MGAALYFIESVPAVSDATIADAELAYALAPGCAHRLASQGPGEADGAVCSLVADGLGFFPERQTWHDIGERNGHRCWFGWTKDARPTPGDLKTEAAIAGQSVKLFDGHCWTVPRAIAMQNGYLRPAVPQSVKWDGKHWVRGAVKQAYKRLDAIGRDFWDRWMVPLEDPAKVVTVAEANDLAAEVLAINYRISRWEIGALELFSFDQAGSAIEVLKAVIDFDGYVAHRLGETQKKTEQ